MTNQFKLHEEPFQFESGFSTGLIGTEWEGEVNRKSRDYIKWVQQSLNQIMGLKLAVDGTMGTQTRSAIRIFQQKQGLKADGDVGDRTETAIKAALAAPGAPVIPAVGVKPAPSAGAQTCGDLLPAVCLDQFDFNEDRLKPEHLNTIRSIADCVVANQAPGQRIRLVHIVGHTDRVGSGEYNFDLARRRAERVRRRLSEILPPSLAAAGPTQVTLEVRSRGECEPVILTNDRVENGLNRRVEVFIPQLPPPQTDCPPFRARIRIHAKILVKPRILLQRMIDNMKLIYGAAGFMVELASEESLNIRHLEDLDMGHACVMPLPALSPEQQELFSNRNRVGPNEIVAYFVRTASTVVNGEVNGCAAHPAGQPSVVVALVASEWTLAHEVGHVLGLRHADDRGPERLRERLMTGGGTGRLIKLPPDLLPCEIRTIDQSNLTINCRRR